MMFVPSMVRRGPGITPGDHRQPVTYSNLCNCGCHPPQKPPPAVEARLCRECADERFQSWADFVEITLR